MKEQLCQSCVSKGLKVCWFVARCNEGTKALPSSKNQTPIAKGTTITKEASEVYENITKDRIRARERLCPQVNFMPLNPKFKNNL